MVRRKLRIPVVIDTNVLVRALGTPNSQSASLRVLRLWLVEKRLQAIVTGLLVEEYLRIFERVLGMGAARLSGWKARFGADPRVTYVNLGRRFSDSRDPDDNLLLALASAGNAQYLVSNDRDLLDLPASTTRRFRFSILTPAELLQILKEGIERHRAFKSIRVGAPGYVPHSGSRAVSTGGNAPVQASMKATRSCFS
ncbi:MAG: putative toxin-antitoxin system toxin component, PIN family [Planctomycetaceae bacterium]